MSKTRAERAQALEEWAERVDSRDLKEADTAALRAIAALADQREEVDADLTAAIRSAREANRSWSEIGAMLGVSKQAAQRKYASKVGSGRNPTLRSSRVEGRVGRSGAVDRGVSPPRSK